MIQGRRPQSGFARLDRLIRMQDSVSESSTLGQANTENLCEICRRVLNALQSQNVKELGEAISSLEDYVHKFKQCDSAVIIQNSILEHLMWIIHYGMFPVELRTLAFVTYIRLIKTKPGDICAHAAKLNHIKGVAAILQYNLLELAELLPDCLFVFAMHSIECHQEIISNRDLVEAMVKIEKESSKAADKVVDLLWALVRRPFDNANFAAFALDNFERILKEQDNRFGDALLGIAFMIEYGDLNLHVAEEVARRSEIICGLWGSSSPETVTGLFWIVRNLARKGCCIPNLDWPWVLSWIDPARDLSDQRTQLAVFRAASLLAEVMTDMNITRTLMSSCDNLLDQLLSLYNIASYDVREELSVCVCKVAVHCHRRYFTTLLQESCMDIFTAMLESNSERQAKECLFALFSMAGAKMSEDSRELLKETLQKYDIVPVIEQIEECPNKSLRQLAGCLIRALEAKPEARGRAFDF